MKYKTAIKCSILVLGVIIIPLLYSYFYLQAFWDPYNTLKNVPVAVVNEDKGATVNGKERNLGKEAEKQLKTNHALKFMVTDKKDADSGVKGTKYYAEIVFPSNFSSDVATASTQNRRVAQVEFTANKKRNYIASQIMKNALSQIEEKVRGSVNSEITVQLVSKLKDVPGQLNKLNNGLNKLGDGTDTMISGSSKIVSAQNTLTNGINTLGSGIGKLSSGANTLTSSINTLNSGIGKLGSGANTLSSSINTLNSGIGKLGSGANTLSSSINTLDSGIGKASDGANKLSAAVSKSVPQLTSGIGTLNSGAQSLLSQFSASTDKNNPTVYDGLNSLSTGTQTYVSTVDNTIYQMIKTNPAAPQLLAGYKQNLLQAEKAYVTATDATTKAAYYQQVKMLANIVTMYTVGTNPAITSESAFEQTLNSAAKADANQASVVSGGGAILSGSQQVLSQFKDGGTFKNGVLQIAGGLSTLDKNTSSLTTLNSSVSLLSSALKTAKTGTDKLAAGSKKLSDNLATAGSGTGKLAAGSKKLSDNLATAGSGAGKLAAGSKKLSDNLTTAESGADTLASGSQKISDADAKIASGAQKIKNGINTAKSSVSDAATKANNQLKKTDGLSDYAKKPVIVKENEIDTISNYGTAFAPYFMSLSLWVGALLIFFGIYLDADERIKILSRHSSNKIVRIVGFAMIGVAQAVALGLIVQFGLGFKVDNAPAYYGSLILISLVFISIIEFFITKLKDFGKFLSIAFLVLNLTACGGTFPMETIPKFFNVIYPFMPMTYSVALFKEISSNFNAGTAAYNAAVLVGIFVVFTALEIIFTITRKAKVRVRKMIEAQNEA